MHHCNGKTHSWSDDSYSQGSYPCPGPAECADAAAREQEKAADALTEADIGQYFDLSEPELAPVVKNIAGPQPCVRTPGADILRAEAEAEFGRWREEDDSNPRETQSYIREVCDEIRDFLIEKNEQYGDSAINPVRIFSRANPSEQLLIRIDDKLSRLARGDDRLESDEDVLDDLIGYLILYKVTKRKAQS